MVLLLLLSLATLDRCQSLTYPSATISVSSYLLKRQTKIWLEKDIEKGFVFDVENFEMSQGTMNQNSIHLFVDSRHVFLATDLN